MHALRSTQRRLLRAVALAVLGITLSVAAATAQEEPTAQQQRTDSAAVAADSVATFMEMMGPAFGMMMERMIDGLMRALERPATAERLATFTRNYYDALIARGFSEEQALRIVVAVGFPAMSGGN